VEERRFEEESTERVEDIAQCSMEPFASKRSMLQPVSMRPPSPFNKDERVQGVLQYIATTPLTPLPDLGQPPLSATASRAIVPLKNLTLPLRGVSYSDGCFAIDGFQGADAHLHFVRGTLLSASPCLPLSRSPHAFVGCAVSFSRRLGRGGPAKRSLFVHRHCRV
jgi:hypothetical protein